MDSYYRNICSKCKLKFSSNEYIGPFGADNIYCKECYFEKHEKSKEIDIGYSESELREIARLENQETKEEQKAEPQKYTAEELKAKLTIPLYQKDGTNPSPKVEKPDNPPKSNKLIPITDGLSFTITKIANKLRIEYEEAEEIFLQMMVDYVEMKREVRNSKENTPKRKGIGKYGDPNRIVKNR